MKFKLKALLTKLVDPRGPLGEIVSPSEVYKERLGLPISSPHTLRHVQQKAPEFAQHTLAPSRFVRVGESAPPKGRVRQVSAYIEERWSPVYEQPPKEQYYLDPVLVGWTVTQSVRVEHCDCAKAKFTLEDGRLIHSVCGRAARSHAANDAELIAIVQSLNIPAADDSFNVFMPTVPGPDAVMTPAGLAKGGTRITHGRREYREKTKGFAHWDSGTLAERARAEYGLKVEMQQKLERHTEGAVKAMPTKFVAKPKSLARERAQGTK